MKLSELRDQIETLAGCVSELESGLEAAEYLVESDGIPERDAMAELSNCAASLASGTADLILEVLS